MPNPMKKIWHVGEMSFVMKRMHIFKCPVCGSEDWNNVYHIQMWSIGECKGCGFARIDPLPDRAQRSEFYCGQEVIKRFEKKRRGIVKLSREIKLWANRVSKRDKTRIFQKKTLRYVPRGGSVFDIGCGDGSYLERMKDQYRCFGIEMSDFLADYARKERHLENIYTGDFQDFPLDGKKFDAITMISLIEHLDDPLRTLVKCFEHLNHNGVLILKTVNYNCVNRKIMKEKWVGLRPPDHIVYFSPGNLERLLRKIGFARVKVSAFPMNDNMYCDAFK